MANEGAVMFLIDLFRFGTDDTQTNAALCLWSLASAGDEEIRDSIIREGDLQLLREASDWKAAEYALRAIHALFANPGTAGALSSSQGVFSYLTDLIHRGSAATQQTIAAVVCNLSPRDDIKRSMARCVAALVKMLERGWGRGKAGSGPGLGRFGPGLGPEIFTETRPEPGPSPTGPARISSPPPKTWPSPRNSKPSPSVVHGGRRPPSTAAAAIPQPYVLRDTLAGHKRAVSSVKFSPDGSLLASASADKTLRVWSTADFSLHAELSGHNEGVSDVSFSADGRYLCSASDDRTIRIWDLATAAPLKTLATAAPLIWDSGSGSGRTNEPGPSPV